jgi:2-keto-4-pentenoate hydratase/2-oxohepta-3-ene-1,7-dioic acid hydratase in catechol pathway
VALKIVRYGERGRERPGVLDASGVVRDLAALMTDWTPAELESGNLARLARMDCTRLPAVAAGTRLGVPVSGIRKFIAIGLNYTDHALEAGLTPPREPVIFMKAISCLSGPDDALVLPRGSRKSDWEVELGVVIGRTARYVETHEALGYVAGYCLLDDASEREYQIERGGTWDKGKGCDTFGPVGPWLVSADEIGDPQQLDLWLEVNGVRHQDGNTARMIFPVAQLIACVSTYMTLEPGDLIATGTPAGVGMGMKPPQYLKAGDRVRLGSSRLGTQTHLVEAWRDGAAF